MGDIVFYSHSGSGNHGCEAIVRGTEKILGNIADMTLLSQAEEEEYKYGINKIVNVKKGKNEINKKSLSFFNAYLSLRLLKNTSKMDVLQFRKAFYRCKKIYTKKFYSYIHRRRYILLFRCL